MLVDVFGPQAIHRVCAKPCARSLGRRMLKSHAALGALADAEDRNEVAEYKAVTHDMYHERNEADTEERITTEAAEPRLTISLEHCRRQQDSERN